MSINPKAATAPVAPKPGKRSILGMLFNPDLGPAIAPLRDTNRVFIHLIAGVFAVYGLFPKKHPAFRDDTVRLTLRDVIATAWGNVELTRDGLTKAIIFFAVVGMIAFSGVTAIIMLLSLFMGHAHAADYSMFQPEGGTGGQDIAYNLMEYIFGGTNGTAFPTLSGTFGDVTSNLENPFAGGVQLQTALFYALGTYSDAILIVAAFILFYHLVAMVAETAAHGVPMGKRASQVWAPIRLVVAIGLLVPINNGLNCGQYIVVKVAEMGSGLASHVWDTFLNSLSYAGKAVPPRGPIVNNEAADIMRMEACMAAWNKRVANQQSGGGGSSNLNVTKKTSTVTLGNIQGQKTSYSGPTAADKDICGWYFIPQGLTTGTQAQSTSITVPGSLATAGNDVTNLQPSDSSSGGGSQAQVTYNQDFMQGINDLQQAVDQAAGQISAAVSMASIQSTLQPYGWAMAGSYINSIERVQAALAASASSMRIITHAPRIGGTNGGGDGIHDDETAGLSANSIRAQTAEDMRAFERYEADSATDPSGSTSQLAQCAAMVGYTAGTENSNIDKLFGLVDWIAGQFGVWNSGPGSVCTSSSATNVNSSFALGVQISGADPLAEMTFLGHANLDAAANLEELAMIASASGAGIQKASANMQGAWKKLEFAGIAGSGAASLLGFMALIFFISGFSLAFLLPIMPFMRFFFATLSWFAAVVEAVIAIPLVALAHLNPEGEGLPGETAKTAYFFIFNIFLRPTLIVFGMLCGLILFMIAVSLLNFGYAIAVADAGGTAYGHAMMSKIIYTGLYVAILYVCANHAFKLIDHIPQHALTWMGKQGQAIPSMGDVDKVEGIAQVASSYAGGQLQSQLGNAAAGGGGALGGLLGPKAPGQVPGLPDTPRRGGGGAAGGADLMPVAGGGHGGGAQNTIPQTPNDARNPNPEGRASIGERFGNMVKVGAVATGGVVAGEYVGEVLERGSRMGKLPGTSESP